MATERWVVYAIFDAEGDAAPFIDAQLCAYRQLGFQTLGVDTSPKLSASRLAIWNRASTRWLRRTNAGYDFGSYGHGRALLIEEGKSRSSQF